MRLLDGLVAVVTGSGRGIGRAEAQRLAGYGARVVVNDTGFATDGSPTAETPAAETVREIRAAGGEAVASDADISTMGGGQAVVDLALDTWGALDVVVNNAGIGRPRMVFNMAEDEWDEVVAVHLKGAFAVSRFACAWWRAEAKAGRRTYGRLVNTATGLLLYGGAGQSNYVAAKAGVLAFSDALATEMAPYGVTVNVVMPSAMTRLAAIGWRMERNVTEPDRGPDAGDPVHVAELVSYLASPAAGWLTGQCFQVRGGIIEHVAPVQVRDEIARTDRGWTADDLGAEMPRLFGAGSKRPDPPPADWRAARA